MLATSIQSPPGSLNSAMVVLRNGQSVHVSGGHGSYPVLRQGHHLGGNWPYPRMQKSQDSINRVFQPSWKSPNGLPGIIYRYVSSHVFTINRLGTSMGVPTRTGSQSFSMPFSQSWQFFGARNPQIIAILMRID